MSRSSSLRQTLQLSVRHSLDVLPTEPSGDCFYDCIHAFFSHENCHVPLAPGKTAPLLRAGKNVPAIATSQSMRDFFSDQLTLEQFELYRMYAMAGVDDYAWMSLNNAPKTLQELKEFAKRSGKTHGEPGKCLWADEFALRIISDGLRITLLIIDDQATRKGNPGRKRKRSVNDQDASSANNIADGRFISIGHYHHAVILHRSRRQHYNAVFIDNCPVWELENLPPTVRSLWPMVRFEEENVTDDKKCCGEIETLHPNCYNVAMDGDKEDEVSEERKESNQLLDENESASPNVVETSKTQYEDVEAQSPSTLINSDQSANSQRQTFGNFYCGCAGFTNSSWVGNFYPKSIVGHNSDRQLNHYQQHMRSVEINSTFYGIPTESTVNKWKQQFSKSFKVVVKAPKSVTHEHDYLDFSVLTFFLSRMQPLRDTLSCVLIQCPRTLTVDVGQLEMLKAELEKRVSWYNGRFAFEFRNKVTYYDEDVRGFLRNNCNFTLVLHPNSLGRSTIGTSVSGRENSNLIEYEPEKLSQVASSSMTALNSNFVYIRLHGSNDEHRGEYTISQLEEIAGQIHEWRIQGVTVFCFVLNDLEPSSSSLTRSSSCDTSSSPKKLQCDKWSSMPKNVKQLEKIVFSLSCEKVPDAPKQPKSTLFNFFSKK